MRSGTSPESAPRSCRKAASERLRTTSHPPLARSLDRKLAHAASAQGIIAVENILGRQKTVDYRSIPAAAFTHPEVSYVGLTETAAHALGLTQGFEVATSKSYFKGNSKALAENDTDGMTKVIYRKDTGEVLGVHIFGPHASDLIHEAAAAIANRQSIQTLAYLVHAHPTLSEVLDEAYKRALVS